MSLYFNVYYAVFWFIALIVGLELKVIQYNVFNNKTVMSHDLSHTILDYSMKYMMLLLLALMKEYFNHCTCCCCS